MALALREGLDLKTFPLEVAVLAPGRIEVTTAAREIIAHLRAGAELRLSMVASDEHDRKTQIHALRQGEDGVEVRPLFSRVTAEVRAELTGAPGDETLRVVLEQTPKLRFFAVLKLTLEHVFEAVSEPLLFGVANPPSINTPHIVGAGEQEVLVYASVTDSDGFEDISSVTLNVTVDGVACTLFFDVEMNVVTFSSADWQGPEPFAIDHCDIEYFTNQVRVVAALRRAHLGGLGAEVEVVAHDHFTGFHRLTAPLGGLKAPPPLPRFGCRYDPGHARARGTGWMAALGSRRDVFPNSAVMAKRPSLPVPDTRWVKDEDLLAEFRRGIWAPKAALKAHFPNESTNGPLVFELYPVTHLMWSYSTRTREIMAYVDHVNRAISMGGLAFRAQEDGEVTLDEMAALDFDLEPRVIPSWKIAFPNAREILSPLREKYWVLVEKRLRQFIDSGATSVQMDDYPNAGVCVTYGGDFCAESLAGFAAWLQSAVPAEERRKAGLPDDLDGFNYRDFLIAEHGIKTAAEYMKVFAKLPTTALFRRYQWQVALESWHRMREMLDRLSPERHITLTSNGAPDWPAPEAYAYNSAIVDAMCAEIHIYPQRPRVDVAALNAYAMTDALGTRLAAVPKGEENTLISVKPFNDKRILHVAESYAFGHQLMVPWGNWRKDVKRLYARWEKEFGITFPLDRDQSFGCDPPHRIAAVFEFVREKAHLLDGFHRYANVAVLLRYKTLSIKMRYIVRRLAAAHVQFTYVIADDTLHPRLLTPEIAGEFDHLLPADAMAAFSEASGVKGQGAVYDPAMARAPMPKPLWCSDPQVYVTIMQKGEGAAQETVLHLLNRHYDPVGEGRAVPAEDLRLRVAKRVLGAGAQRFEIHSFRDTPGITVTEHEDEYRVSVSALRYWALLHARPADRPAGTVGAEQGEEA